MLAFDIETVPDIAAAHLHPEKLKSFLSRHEKAAADPGMLAIYPLWSKVCCICYGTKPSNVLGLSGDDEAAILEAFAVVLKRGEQLCGHNIKRFDAPFLAFRYLANGMEVPESLRSAGKKPWELTHVDTMELLQFGGGQFVSLSDACRCFGIEDPKQECDGSQVAALYKDGKFGEIEAYCKADVVATMRLYGHLAKLGGN